MNQFPEGFNQLFDVCLNIRERKMKFTKLLVLYNPSHYDEEIKRDIIDRYFSYFTPQHNQQFLPSREDIKLLLQQREDLAERVGEFARQKKFKEVELLGIKPSIGEAEDFSRVILTSGLLELLKNYDIMINLSITPLRFNEFIQKSRIRGIDLHLVSKSSFVSGAMTENYNSLRDDAKKYERVFNKVTSIKIVQDEGEEITMEVVRQGHATGACGVIDKRKNRHPFLPSGCVYSVVSEERTNGVITLEGPAFVYREIEPTKLRIEFGEIVRVNDEPVEKSDCTLIRELRNMCRSCPSGRRDRCGRAGGNPKDQSICKGIVSEICLGLNSRSSLTCEPYEFQNERGVITIAFGNNNHLGGSNYCEKHIHATVKQPARLILLDDEMSQIPFAPPMPTVRIKPAVADPNHEKIERVLSVLGALFCRGGPSLKAWTTRAKEFLERNYRWDKMKFFVLGMLFASIQYLVGGQIRKFLVVLLSLLVLFLGSLLYFVLRHYITRSRVPT